jgi:hypothetical protein
MRGGTSEQLLFYQRQLSLVQPRQATGTRYPFQLLSVMILPCQPPLADALFAHPKKLCNRRLSFSMLKQLNSFLSSLAQLF